MRGVTWGRGGRGKLSTMRLGDKQKIIMGIFTRLTMKWEKQKIHFCLQPDWAGRLLQVCDQPVTKQNITTNLKPKKPQQKTEIATKH